MRREADRCNKTITLIRTPTWSGDLSAGKRQRKIREEIVKSVSISFKDTGPHAFLLVVDVTSTITEVTRKTLESILTEKLWNHTIVVFANIEKLKHSIDVYIHTEGLLEFMKQCGHRKYAVKTRELPNQSGEMIQKFEEMIAGKTELYFQFSQTKDKDIKKTAELLEEILLQFEVIQRKLKEKKNKQLKDQNPKDDEECFTGES